MCVFFLFAELSLTQSSNLAPAYYHGFMLLNPFAMRSCQLICGNRHYGNIKRFPSFLLNRLGVYAMLKDRPEIDIY